jgi:hypothetical protein
MAADDADAKHSKKAHGDKHGHGMSEECPPGLEKQGRC